jgi:peptidoglycan/LPS O-acetylase OafA/YrhL
MATSIPAKHREPTQHDLQSAHVPATHLRSLTSLRFFAAMMVVAYHSAIQSSGDGSQPHGVLRFGYLGVTFFFVLSGFVLVWSAREGDRAGQFYRRRFARVWPLHALTFVLAVALGASTLIHHRGPGWSGALNVTLLQAWSRDHEVIYGFNGVSWSLSAEAFFYAMFPLLVLAARRAGGLATTCAGVAWLVAGATLSELTNDGWWSEVLPAYRIGEFVIGMGLALLVRRGAPRMNATVAACLLVGAYAAAVVLNRVTAGGLTYRPWLAALLVLPGLALLLIGLAQRDVEGSETYLTSPTLVRLGQWSFALYMIHELMLRAASPVMVDHRWTVPLAILVCIAAAGLLYERFERPVEQRLRGQSRPAVQLEPATS